MRFIALKVYLTWPFEKIKTMDQTRFPRLIRKKKKKMMSTSIRKKKIWCPREVALSEPIRNCVSSRAIGGERRWQPIRANVAVVQGLCTLPWTSPFSLIYSPLNFSILFTNYFIFYIRDVWTEFFVLLGNNVLTDYNGNHNFFLVQNIWRKYHWLNSLLFRHYYNF